MKNRKKPFLGLCLGLSLLGNNVAYAMAVVPPNPSWTSSIGPSGTNNGSTQNSGPGAAIGPDPGSAAVTTIKEPQIQSQGAVLYNATTNTILYEKNGNTKYFPASITKLLTALLVLENSNLNETVTFSESAVKNLESGSVTLNLTPGDTLSVKDSLYALMLRSANEVANGLAEHVSGSIENFTAKMNERARALGCTTTNFVTTNGLNHPDHYTTAKDMALIAAEVFRNSELRNITSTVSYQIPATKLAGARTITMGHKMIAPSDFRYYQGILGGKTGYTSLAGNTLVTCAERDGVRLIAIILKSKQTHYEDTKAMLDYGFALGGKQSQGNRWQKDSTGWQFIKSDNSKVTNQWMNIDGEDYWFDSGSYMATGWRQFTGGNWYYFRSGGSMAKDYWMPDNGAWYYLGSNGVMLKNTTTPDQYYVDQNGRWIQ